MMFLVSGEGPSDIGGCTNGAESCEGADFKAGPMTLLIDQLVTPIWWGNSPLATGALVFVGEAVVGGISREIGVALPGAKKAMMKCAT